MTALVSFSDTGDNDLYDRIATALSLRGYIVLDSALPEQLVNRLFIHYQSIHAFEFKPAGIGRDTDHHINPFVRTDQIFWLDNSVCPCADYLAWIEHLRLELNRRLFLGLFDYECHYTYYPAGAFYKTHLDAFHGNTNRVISTVLYLNPNWMQEDGGELVLYCKDNQEPLEIVAPLFARMAIFLSTDFPHEVIRTNRPRRSLAGWFRINTTTDNVLDPPDNILRSAV